MLILHWVPQQESNDTPKSYRCTNSSSRNLLGSMMVRALADNSRPACRSRWSLRANCQFRSLPLTPRQICKSKSPFPKYPHPHTCYNLECLCIKFTGLLPQGPRQGGPSFGLVEAPRNTAFGHGGCLILDSPGFIKRAVSSFYSTV